MNRPLTSQLTDWILRGLLWSLVIVVALGALAPEVLLLSPGEIAAALGSPVCALLAVLATLWAAGQLQPRLQLLLGRAFHGNLAFAGAASRSTMVSYVLFGLAYALLDLPDPVDWLRTRDILGLASGHVGRVLMVLGLMTALLTWRALRKHLPSGPTPAPTATPPPVARAPVAVPLPDIAFTGATSATGAGPRGW